MMLIIHDTFFFILQGSFFSSTASLFLLHFLSFLLLFLPFDFFFYPMNFYNLQPTLPILYLISHVSHCHNCFCCCCCCFFFFNQKKSQKKRKSNQELKKLYKRKKKRLQNSMSLPGQHTIKLHTTTCASQLKLQFTKTTLSI